MASQPSTVPVGLHRPPCPKYETKFNNYGRSQWARGLRRGSEAARLLGLWVRITPGALICLLCVLCVVGSGLCDGLITRTEESWLM
jgi:hypothetical protein